MDSLDLIKTFCEVATQGSFSQAAKKLDISKAAASKYVAELESRFGVRLLNRSTRSVSLTDAGQLLMERSRPMLDLIALTQAELQERSGKPSGRVRLAVPHGMSHSALPRLLGQFMHLYPEIVLSLEWTNRRVDLAEEDIDLSLYPEGPADPDLVVRRMARMRLAVCASPAYWRKRGMPAHPGELSQHAALTQTVQGPNPSWRFEVDGQPLDVPVTSRMDATENGPLIQWAIHGLGVVYLSALLLREPIARGELVPVLQAHVRQDMRLAFSYHRRRQHNAALHVLLDFLEARMGAVADEMANPQALTIERAAG